MTTFRDFDTFRSQMNRMMNDFGRGFGGRGFGGGFGQQGGFGGLGGWDEDMFDIMPTVGFGLSPWDVNYGFPSLTSGTDIGIGGQQQQQGRIQSSKQAEEQKMQDIASQQGGQQLSTLPQQGTMTQTFAPNQWIRARVNVEEQPDKLIVTADLPGFDKQNIKVNLTDDGRLTIKGEQSKEWTDQSKDKRYLRAERVFSNVHRTLRLPKNVDANKVSAEFVNGVLHVNVPKTEDKSKKTDINIQ